ncbi:hypothetical protein [Anaeromicropila populeti]|uniref:Ig-like domain (Group 3) n=1 Tax=Anaeromicropila populeti TaxID=37658 RepID=A0A1I6JLT0_9FIRM|nr:hypothetical protein [Anaeromicropila populeti]SFR79904.1 hypothetical protein SAMN05661086_01732 [Anaeromicropila populeti]
MKKRLRQLFLITIIAVSSVILSGCYGGQTVTMMVNEDGTGKMGYEVCIDEETYNELYDGEATDESQMEQSGFTKSTKMIEGKNYVCFKKLIEVSSLDEMKEILVSQSAFSKTFMSEEEVTESDSEGFLENVELKKDFFRGVYKAIMTPEEKEEFDSSEYMTDYDMFTNISLSFAKEITATNGELSSDKKTVTWKMEYNTYDFLCYATTASEDIESVTGKDETAPVISGVKNNQLARKTVCIKCNDYSGIKSVTLNGSSIGNEHYVTKAGTYTVTATDNYDNATSVTFTIDTTRPKVSGVTSGKTYKKNKTIKFTDKSGIKSAKLNGKTIKSGYVVKKSGTYTLKVTDKAGNVKTVKFKIKK